MYSLELSSNLITSYPSSSRIAYSGPAFSNSPTVVLKSISSILTLICLLSLSISFLLALIISSFEAVFNFKYFLASCSFSELGSIVEISFPCSSNSKVCPS